VSAPGTLKNSTTPVVGFFLGFLGIATSLFSRYGWPGNGCLPLNNCGPLPACNVRRFPRGHRQLRRGPLLLLCFCRSRPVSLCNWIFPPQIGILVIFSAVSPLPWLGFPTSRDVQRLLYHVSLEQSPRLPPARMLPPNSTVLPTALCCVIRTWRYTP